MIDKEQVLQKVGEWISTTANQIGDFASREIPPFIHEYLAWKFWENAAGIIGHFVLLGLLIGFIVTAYKLNRKCYAKYIDTKDADWGAGTVITGLISGTASIILSVVWLTHFPKENVFNCIQIKIAPKVYLIEKAAEIYQQAKN